MNGTLAIALTVLKWVGLGLLGLVLAVVAGSALVPPLTRPLTDRWGATDAELAATLPGDELVGSAEQVSTKAVTIDAPADVVYSLVVQQGYQRAGWHGWDWFYRATGSAGFVDGGHSKRIVPELQDVAPGDMIYINEMVGYEVVTASRPNALVLYGGTGEAGEFVGPGQPLPSKHHAMSWAWVVRPETPDRTRLILRIRSEMPGESRFVRWLFDKPLDFGGALFGRKTLVGIKNLAEELTAESR